MKKQALSLAMILGTIFLWGTLGPDSAATAQETLRYSQAAQVYRAFGAEGIELFQKKTGIQVEVFVSSSPSAVNRLMNDFADIASTTRQLYYRYSEYGYVEVPFCKDPLAVIVHASCPVTGLTTAQVEEVFSGGITNWQALGGPDAPIMVVVPGKDTGANQNFRRQVMKRKEIVHDIMTEKSTAVIDLIEKFPLSISFISRGASIGDAGIKALKIDGLSPGEPEYPLYQIFSYVTKGEPSGPVKALVDFAFSAEAQDLMRKKGMLPISRTP
ncbi:MAG: substrate-binding domain-containing protein [Desulfobacterales bacterium]|jgi:phosphate transport system substrate-binding protein|nr:substrate-binding domain-containing protein [Desulfobacterales bacterium]